MDKKRCIKCNSTMGYYRIKNNEFVCRTCGYIEKSNSDNPEEINKKKEVKK